MRPISDEEQDEFDAITSGGYSNFMLVSTEFDGEETVAIVATVVTVDPHTSTVEYNLQPLYVRVTEAMFKRMANPAKDLPGEDDDEEVEGAGG